MWIVLLGLIGLVAGVALVLGFERRYAKPLLAFALLGLAVGGVAGMVRVVPAASPNREPRGWRNRPGCQCFR